ncbi:hypothetical protein ACYT69_11245, partial [Streptococcus pyogenes]
EERSGEVEPTASTDVYALGALVAKVFGDAAPADVKKIVARATAADAAERYPDARPMLEELERALASNLASASGTFPAVRPAEERA